MPKRSWSQISPFVNFVCTVPTTVNHDDFSDPLKESDYDTSGPSVTTPNGSGERYVRTL